MPWAKRDIVSYYRSNEFAYRLWGRNMHYGFWEKDTKTLRQATQRFNEVLARRARITDKDWVLDAGCGVGGSSIFLAKTYGCRVTGLTICPRQVVQAKKNAVKQGVAHLVEFHEMDYMATAFKAKVFDVVWGLESICYAESKERFIRESYRVLNDRGRLVVADGFASRESYEGADRRLMDEWLDGWIVNHLDTPERFARFARDAGFRDIGYRDVTTNVMRTSTLMYYVSFPFMFLHQLNKIVRLGPYPTDALYHQYHALKRGLWQYGVFYAAKQAAEDPGANH
jgi:cyclopropane fatty-acyl-phospholipid synthase-like methyltransferase